MGVNPSESQGALRELAVGVRADTGNNSDNLSLDAFIHELQLSKRELEIARNQFDTVTDPMLIDHIVFRLGAAERHFNYLFQLARRFKLNTGDAHVTWGHTDAL